MNSLLNIIKEGDRKFQDKFCYHSTENAVVHGKSYQVKSFLLNQQITLLEGVLEMIVIKSNSKLKQFANTPLDKRPDGFTFLSDYRYEISSQLQETIKSIKI